MFIHHECLSSLSIIPNQTIHITHLDLLFVCFQTNVFIIFTVNIPVFIRRTMYFIMVFIRKVTSAMLKLSVYKLYIGGDNFEYYNLYRGDNYNVLFAPNIKPCTGLFSADFQINQLVRLWFLFFYHMINYNDWQNT